MFSRGVLALVGDVVNAILRRACSRVRAGFGMSWRYLFVGIFGSM